MSCRVVRCDPLAPDGLGQERLGHDPPDRDPADHGGCRIVVLVVAGFSCKQMKRVLKFGQPVIARLRYHAVNDFIAGV